MKQIILILILATVAANAAERTLGRLPNGQLYIKDELEFCLKAEPARALSRADNLRQKVATARLIALHPAIANVVGNHLSAERWLNGESLPAALKHTGADVPVIVRSLTAMLVPEADAAVVVEELRQHPDVEWASLNVLEPVTEIPNDPQWANQWGPSRILATNGWDVPQATTTLRVAIVDTGVDLTHPDLPIVYNRGFGGNPTGDAQRDVRGGTSIDHGTHVAGIAAATRNNNIGIAGTARLGIMAMGCAVWGTNSAGVGVYLVGSGDVAINDAVANNATVINCSFGQAAPLSAAMSNALNNAENAGVIVVCAAGNDTNNILSSPSAGWAAHSWPIIVSNIQQNDTPNPSSNFGNPISLAAPGTGILSTFTTNYTAPAAGGTYGTMTGTSQASPHVAGAAGMVRSMNPNRIGSRGTRDLLFRMAQDLGAPGRDPIYGFGMLQLPASFLSPLKSANTFAGPNLQLQDGSYELPYATIPDAIGATPAGGTIILNGGYAGTSAAYPAQTINTPVHGVSGSPRDNRQPMRNRAGTPRSCGRKTTMNTGKLFLVLGVSVFAVTALGQSYSIDWHTIDGGGGTSTGGAYSVSGTIGQPDAGKMSGGNFTIDGGLWGIIAAVPMPGAPWLSISRSNNLVMVTWPSPSTGFTLQQNLDLNTTNWVTPSETVTDNGTIKFINVNPPIGNRFYRLIKP